jgi:deoxyhypusine synthase
MTDAWQRPLRVLPDMTVAALLDELAQSSFGARSVAQACRLARTWKDIPGFRVILTVSGALSIAQQTSIVAQLIDAGRIHAIVTTGAVVTHSLTQEAGGRRRPVQVGETDEHLAALGLNRVFDTIESDSNLNVLRDLVGGLPHVGLNGRVGSATILRHLGMSSGLLEKGLLRSASTAGVPIFVPALSDSELGLRLSERAAPEWTYDAFEDLAEFRRWIEEGHDHGLLSLGGGVPRNWAQQMFAEVNEHGARQVGSRLVSGIRVCPDATSLGHLSGSTFSEARSWRKIPHYDDGAYVEVSSDFTIVFPLIAVAMLSD